MACSPTACQTPSLKQSLSHHLSVRLFSKCLGDKKKFCGEALPGNAVVRRRVGGGAGGGGGEGRLYPAMQWCMGWGAGERGGKPALWLQGRPSHVSLPPVRPPPSLLSGEGYSAHLLPTFCLPPPPPPLR